MENSIEQDYVTEKVYHSFQAGCVPIYLGAPNVNDYIPDANAIINYAQLGTPKSLLAELERLAANETAYQEKLAWKQMSLESMSPGVWEGADGAVEESLALYAWFCFLTALLLPACGWRPYIHFAVHST